MHTSKHFVCPKVQSSLIRVAELQPVFFFNYYCYFIFHFFIGSATRLTVQYSVPCILLSKSGSKSRPLSASWWPTLVDKCQLDKLEAAIFPSTLEWFHTNTMSKPVGFVWKARKVVVLPIHCLVGSQFIAISASDKSIELPKAEVMEW